MASGRHAHAEGSGCIASGDSYTHAEGCLCTISGDCSHAEGRDSQAVGIYAHTEGAYSEASGNCSHAGGVGTIALTICQTAIGGSNVASADEHDIFIVGNGRFNYDVALYRSNCFRVTLFNGVYATGAYNTSGADYAEMFEWMDGNPDKQDRAGLFVTLDGAKIRVAGPEDDYILGIVSGNPSIVGDVHDDQWQRMYLSDIFGRPVWENIEVPEQIDPARAERRQKLNPYYDNTQKYMPRSQRSEWDSVGMLGKLAAVDDGTCQVNRWCTVGKGGIATVSENRTKYRVMERLNENSDDFVREAR